MKRFFSILTLILLIASCDDGDIIYTTLDFDDIPLQYCGDVGDYVFFKINDENRETLSLRLLTTDSIFWVADTFSYPVGVSGHSVDYRVFDGPVSANYFCSPVPPVSPRVEESHTGTGGTAELVTTPVFYENDTTPVSDSIIAHRTNIQLRNLKMEGSGETIIRSRVEMGVVVTPVSQ